MSENKTCFVIMPISDQEGYEKGHFNRVFEHLIKPACLAVGFNAIRADEEVKTNYIVVDIIKKILDSDMVICDLSAKNPNVLYELGLRQAFNKKVVLIKDKITTRIFDIQGLRTIEYDGNLRIDEVGKGISQISNSLLETYNSPLEDINSLIQLLSITPAELPSKISISQESGLILDSLNDISKRLQKLEYGDKRKHIILNPKKVFVGGYRQLIIGDVLETSRGTIGIVEGFDSENVTLVKDGLYYKYPIDDPIFNDILPF